MTVWTKMDVRNTVPTRMPVTPSMTVVPATRDLTFQVCGGTSGCWAWFLPELEGHRENRRDGEGDEHTGREPAVLLGGAESVDEGGEAADDGGGADHVELRDGDARRRGAGMTLRPDQEGEGADGCVDPEDGLPAGPGGEGSAEQDAGGDAEGPDGTPQGESEAALRAGVGGHDDGQRGRGHQSGGQALSGAGRDELACPTRESADDGCDREHGQAGQEHPLAGQQVRDAATEQQPAAGHHEVGSDDPLHVGAVQFQVASDGGQGRVDDRDVEDDEDLRGEGEGQDGPRLARPVLGL